MTWISTKRRKLRMPTVMRHRGIDTRRRERNHRENAFAETWEQENERRPGLNFGQGMLQDLLAQRSEKWPHYPSLRKVVDNRDAAIVATVVQWLGTNVGMSFLGEALKRCGFRIERDPAWERKGGDFCSQCRGKDRWRHEPGAARGEVTCGWCGIGKPIATMRNSKGEPAMVTAAAAAVEPTIRVAVVKCPACRSTLQVCVEEGVSVPEATLLERPAVCSEVSELEAAQHALEAYKFESESALCRAVTEKEEAQAALERAKGTVRRLSTHLLDTLIEDCIHDVWLLRALQPELEALCDAIERAKGNA